jgi:hypothetical protein
LSDSSGVFPEKVDGAEILPGESIAFRCYFRYNEEDLKAYCFILRVIMNQALSSRF